MTDRPHEIGDAERAAITARQMLREAPHNPLVAYSTDGLAFTWDGGDRIKVIGAEPGAAIETVDVEKECPRLRGVDGVLEWFREVCDQFAAEQAEDPR